MSEADVADRNAVLASIASARPGWLRRFGWAIALFGVAVGVTAFFLWPRPPAEGGWRYRTKPAVRGDLSALVSATGTLRGIDTVQIGAEVNGRVKSVLVDFNDRVKAGQVLCEIDPEQLRALRDQVRAQLVAAEAEHKSRRATAAEADLAVARAEDLARQDLISAAELEQARAAALRAHAAAEAGAAQIVVVKAALENAETQLSRTIIRAPQDGVVLSRAVEVGQTVIASLQAPVLFTIAKDLRRMEVIVKIDEADIGHVREGQRATFTVDAFPERRFEASLRLIANVATLEENVVTYEARLDVENADLALRPGMTATVDVLTEERRGVLLVPNAALRFKPPSREGGPRGMPFLPMRGAGRPAGAPNEADGGKAVYVLRDGAPVRVKVETGLSDGTSTEILGEPFPPGAEIVIDASEEKPS